jgi:hypothetical protein
VIALKLRARFVTGTPNSSKRRGPAAETANERHPSVNDCKIAGTYSTSAVGVRRLGVDLPMMEKRIAAGS